jgi:hypothetical protein
MRIVSRIFIGTSIPNEVRANQRAVSHCGRDGGEIWLAPNVTLCQLVLENGDETHRTL